MNMFITVLFTLFLFQFNNAVVFTVSSRNSGQSFTMYVGDVPIVLMVHDIRDDIHGGDCTGTCTINTITTLFPSCNVIDIPGSRHLRILIQNRAEKIFTGSWQCNFRTRGPTASEQPIEFFNFDMVVKEVDLTTMPALPSIDDVVEFKIISDVVNNFTLDEGNRNVVMIITEMREQFSNELCNGGCEINQKETITTSSCSMNQLEKSSNIKLILNTLKVTKSHAGSWKCYYRFPQKNGGQPTNLGNINITVNAADESIDIWLYVAILAGVLVILAIIIGQTICIIHFKSKAKKAQINKNLTPNKNSDDSPGDVRYVRKTSGNGEVRESVIYEALETVRGGAPIPPPIETLPVTPKPGPMSRSFSQNNISVNPDERMTKTSPRMPKNQQKQGKFNTVARIQSLERIRNRPPLPTPDEIYEVMAPGDAVEPTKSGWFKNKTLEQSPLLAKQKKSLFGQNQPESQDQRESPPKVTKKPGVPLPGPNRMLTGQGPVGPGTKPGIGRPPVGATAVMGAMPMLPSMIAAANLKPVKKAKPVADSPTEGFKMPPPPENLRTRGFKTPHDTPRFQDSMPETQDHSRLHSNAFKDSPRMQGLSGFRPDRFPQPSRVQNVPKMPGSGFRMPVDSRNDQPVPFPKPKPQLALSELEPEPIDFEHEPEPYYGSSDEEFDCYDVLPEYRIYGNAPPKKLQ